MSVREHRADVIVCEPLKAFLYVADTNALTAFLSVLQYGLCLSKVPVKHSMVIFRLIVVIGYRRT